MTKAYILYVHHKFYKISYFIRYCINTIDNIKKKCFLRFLFKKIFNFLQRFINRS